MKRYVIAGRGCFLFLALSLGLSLSACGSTTGPEAAVSPNVSPNPFASASDGASTATKPAAASKPAPSGGAQQASPTATHMAVSYGSVSGSQLPVFVAQDAGIFKKNGLSTDLKYVMGAASISALLAGDLQVVLPGGSDAIGASAQGADVAVLATIVPVYNFVIQVTPEIKAPQNLKGKKLGVTSLGSATDIALRVGLRKIGLDPNKDVSIVAVGSSQNSGAALLNGLIQGTVVSPGPDSIKLTKAGFPIVLDLTALHLPASTQTITVRKSLIASDRPAVQRVVDSMIQSIVTIKKDKQVAVSILSKYLKLDDQQALEAIYDANVKVFQSLPYTKPDQFADALEELGKGNAKIKDFDLSKLIDNSFIDSAASRGIG